MPGTVLGAGSIAVTKADKTPCPYGAYLGAGGFSSPWSAIVASV